MSYSDHFQNKIQSNLIPTNFNYLSNHANTKPIKANISPLKATVIAQVRPEAIIPPASSNLTASKDCKKVLPYTRQNSYKRLNEVPTQTRKLHSTNSARSLKPDSVNNNKSNDSQLILTQSGAYAQNEKSNESGQNINSDPLPQNTIKQKTKHLSQSPVKCRGNTSKCSNKKNGLVKGYGANTNQGLVRAYNEDRVSIVLSITKPSEYSNPNDLKSSLFAIYDGHGGTKCAEFLRDNFYQFLIKDANFPSTPALALKNACLQAEKTFLNLVESTPIQGVVDKSGSCAIIILVIMDRCYCANVGDSRAILCINKQNVKPLSRDHKPSDELEQTRIIEAGGKTYSNTSSIGIGPVRILPGRLSVSRSFGDIEAKLSRYGGNSKVLICDPDITQFQIKQDSDFIFLGSDGIYDKLTNEEISQTIWSTAKSYIKEHNSRNVHDACGFAAEAIVNLALKKNSLDNVTALLISLPGFKNYIKTGGCPQKPLLSLIPQSKEPIKNESTIKNSSGSNSPNTKQKIIKSSSTSNFTEFSYPNSVVFNTQLVTLASIKPNTFIDFSRQKNKFQKILPFQKMHNIQLNIENKKM